MLQKSKNLAIRARLEGSAPEVQVYLRRNEKVTQFRFFVSRSPESIVSARAETRARANVGQSVGPQPFRVGAAIAARKASVAFPRGLRLKLGMQSFCPLIATPNPSIERTRSGSAGLAFISFWAKPAPPPRAAHVKR